MYIFFNYIRIIFFLPKMKLIKIFDIWIKTLLTENCAFGLGRTILQKRSKSWWNINYKICKTYIVDSELIKTRTTKRFKIEAKVLQP